MNSLSRNNENNPKCFNAVIRAASLVRVTVVMRGLVSRV